MADNTELNAGTGGDFIATDEIAGVKHQRVKIQYGVDGQATDVSDTNPLPIDDAGGSLTVDNPALSVTGGGLEASALRVTLASDSTGVLSVDDGGASLTVDNAALSVTGGGAEATALRVTLANDSTGVLSVDDNGGSLTVDNSTLSVVGGGTEATALRVTLANDSTGVVSVDDNGGSLTVDVGAALPAGANLIGDVGISVRTSGGSTLYKNIDVDETEDQVKASAGQIYWLHAINLASTPRYLKIYNATAASVTVGTTVPDLTFPIPSQGSTNGAGFTISIPNGIAFSTAITIAATTGVADADTGAPGANEVIVNLGYS